MPPRKRAETTVTALDATLADIEALYPGTMMMASDPDLQVVRRETGVLPLDLLLEGGLPRGRIIEVYGSYSTLKSYYAYKAIAAAQKRGEKVALIDYERSFDPEWGVELGIDLTKLPISRPKTAEQGIGTMDSLIVQKYDLIVWDSIAAAQPKQYREAAPGEDDAPAALARVLSRGIPRLLANNKHTTCIFINQTRALIGQTAFGPKSTTSGGKAMGYYASLRMSFTRVGMITKEIKRWDGSTMVGAKLVVGHRIQCTLEKSKVSKPYSTCHFVFDLMTGSVDDVGYLIGVGIESGMIKRTKTGHYTMPGIHDKSIHGATAFREWLIDHPDIQDLLMKEAMSA